MTAAHLHLMVNHLPLFAVLFALVLLGLGLWRPLLPVVRRTGLVLLMVGAVGAGAAFLTGEPAEEIVEHQEGVDDATIHEHEEAGEFAMIVTVLTGVLGLGILWRSRGREVTRAATTTALVAGVVAMGALSRTAWLGGQIQHPELRGDGAAAPVSGGGEAADDHD